MVQRNDDRMEGECIDESDNEHGRGGSASPAQEETWNTPEQREDQQVVGRQNGVPRTGVVQQRERPEEQQTRRGVQIRIHVGVRPHQRLQILAVVGAVAVAEDLDAR